MEFLQDKKSSKDAKPLSWGTAGLQLLMRKKMLLIRFEPQFHLLQSYIQNTQTKKKKRVEIWPWHALIMSSKKNFEKKRKYISTLFPLALCINSYFRHFNVHLSPLGSLCSFIPLRSLVKWNTDLQKRSRQSACSGRKQTTARKKTERGRALILISLRETVQGHGEQLGIIKSYFLCSLCGDVAAPWSEITLMWAVGTCGCSSATRRIFNWLHYSVGI